MKRRAFFQYSGLVAAGAALLGGPAAGQQAPPAPKAQAKLPPPVNPFQQEGNWYKAALHVHTKTSDGDVDVATRLAQYRSAGFHVVAVTDHWKTNDLTPFAGDGFLAINSMEAHPLTGTGAPAHHFVCLDVPHPFELAKELPAQQLLDTVKRAGGKVVYAHPYWTAHSIEEMQEVSGYVAVEVYNGHCDLASAKGFSRVHIDQLLNKGLYVGLTAVDDIHKSAWMGQGWTMIRAKGLNKADIMEAFGKGSFYASCGPTIVDFRVENGTVSLKASPVMRIRFLYNGSGGGRLFQAESGKTLTEARWKLAGGRKPAKWVRAEVVDKDGKHAWTNPLMCA
jgi:hypothetical protein